MNPEFVTIEPDVPLEEAALLMLKKRLDRLLIVEDGALAGIITYTDIFRQLVTILGGGGKAIRLTLEMVDRPGSLASIAGMIASLGGNITSVATAGKTVITIRVDGVGWETLRQALDEEDEVQVRHVCGHEIG